MRRKCSRGVIVASVVMASAIWSSSVWALEPGNYTLQCQSPENQRADRATYNIKMDVIDLLTLKNSFGAITSGVRLDDGRRIILTGDHGCALIETRSRSSK
jgi:hypothetical protein